MERTTIYLDEDLKGHLLEIAAEESKRKGKRAAMADIVREAIRDYLAKRGVVTSEKNSITRRMLSTRGALGKDFEKRVKKVKADLEKWEIRSA